MEGDKVCMNVVCSSSNSIEWKKGWPLRSGGFATLCDNCGTAYKELVFCEMFHSEETGWRECTSCGKRVHCGCIASSSLLELLDTGGVNCIGCTKNSNLPPVKQIYASSEIAKSKSGDDAEKDCHNIDTIPTKVEDNFEIGYKLLSSFNQPSTEPSKNYDTLQESTSAKCLVQTKLSIGLPASSNLSPLSRVVTEERESTTAISSLQQGCRPHHILPRLPISPLRVARPPVEGRVKNQLLPRYWPRITDQELQQISGDSNSTIVPLFEKVLSASDAGRIGRLVLPKACAEAYFPPISQPEGLPLRIQDVKGKEWTFQFRFWPNNNSRMYVLEGVTPCIQSMQLQAGDTVTFSRMDPEGKLLMGFRKAIQQDSHTSMNIGAFQSEPILAAAENVHIMNGYSGLLQSLKGSRSCAMTEKNQVAQQLLLPERKRSRNIGPKSKRLLMDDHDVLELKFSWDEVQDMLRPPPNVKPSTISVDDHEFEEFEEPPVFGKRSIFIVRLSGEHEQWAQCDSCFKWRKLPVDFLLPPKWTCQDNEFKKQRVATSFKSTNENESHDPETKAIGGEINGASGSSTATTTKHPRHRPGCSCIVCIQPPSGKGKHKPTCTCNVCMTVKRRFKTLMMRKKKRQSEREAEIAQRNYQFPSKEEAEVDSIPDQLDNVRRLESGEKVETFKGNLDLNSCPGKEEQHTMMSRVSMTSLVQEASLCLDTYLRQNGLTSLVLEQREASPDAAGESVAQTLDGQDQEHEGSDDSKKDEGENDPS
ncbi:hypothetical protein RD792_012147 [Penstemon davidsonii]|uniref:B3 domain-containing transcription repressor VAL2 n=1 Tax=Penstemon davidsonii TaxID=160366 RepID=A0ABR0CW22_9LAMI|nr:hypothetical protein RD792_012147 [Penstemon davidsonii]